MNTRPVLNFIGKFNVICMAVMVSVILFTLVLSGCGNKEQSENGKVTITFAGWGNPFEVKLFNDLAAEFERDNPDIDVKFVHIPQNYDAVLLTMIAGGKAPDVFYAMPWTLGNMLSKGTLMNLDPYLEKSKVVKLDDIFPQTIDPYRWDGKQFGKGGLYGICKDWSPDYMVFYNKKLFDEAKIPYPDGSWTRDEFVEVAKKLTRRDDKGRIVQFGVYNNCAPEQWIWQSGGQMFTDDRKRCLLESPESIEALQFAVDLTNKWHVAPGYAEQQQGAVNVMFETGRVAMCFYGQWFVPQFRDSIKDFKWGVTTPPKHKRDINLSGGMVGYGIYSRTPHPEESWRFMEFLVGPKGQKALAKIGWNIPSSRVVAMSPAFRENPDLDPEITETFLQAAKKTRLFDRSPYISPAEFNLYFLPQWELLMLGEKSVPQAMKDATKQINQAIKDNMAILGEEDADI